MHSNKGVYALLLGSGISRSSGIPTGWDIVQDLIKRLAALKEESCAPDPDTWFRATFAVEPEYSEVLHQIAKTPAERQQLLRGYFEPTEEEREEGLKKPTRAHRAIAELVSKGYVRVIVTTNFDRLLEQALVDVGIQPLAISTPDGAMGALPLAHAPSTVIKVNGDYLDTRIKNTRGELEQYEKPMDKLLDRVFDEYGLIVCGWSADWDTALRGALERCSTRRFTTYWASRGTPKGQALDIVSFRGAQLVSITDADSFFHDVSEKIEALETFSSTTDLSPQVAVARLKKYLADDAHRISLHDLLLGETEKAHSVIAGIHLAGGQISGPAIISRLRAYEAGLEIILPLTICGTYWGQIQHHAQIVQCFKRLADMGELQSGFVLWSNLRRYPALLLAYGIGLAAIARSDYILLNALLHEPIRGETYKAPEITAKVLSTSSVLEPRAQKVLPGRENEYTPLSNHLFETLRAPLRPYIPDDTLYEQSFEWFEYLFCLLYCDARVTRESLAEMERSNPAFILRAFPGRFVWKQASDQTIMDMTELSKGEPYPPRVSGILRAGMFESGGALNDDKYMQVKAAFDRFLWKRGM